MGLMTPIMKGVMTDVGFSNAVLAQQMYGGTAISRTRHGAVRADARIACCMRAPRHSGADLVGRKLPRDGGRP